MPSPSLVRIAVWPGGCLWIGRTTEPFDGAEHAHHAIQLSFLLDGGMRIRTEGGEFAGRVILIDADVRHSISVNGRVAHLFIEPESAAGRALRSRAKTAPTPTLPPAADCERALATFDRLWNEQVVGERLQDEGAALLDRLAAPATRGELDWRITKILETIDLQLDSRIDFGSACAGVYLSHSRLRHLFAEQVGLSFKSYVLWRRLMVAVGELGQGSAITAAAHQAGFADGAHFSRTFRRTFGLAANMLAYV